MATFQLNFRSDFSGVSSPNARVRLRLAESAVRNAEAFASLQAVASSLAAIDHSITQQISELQNNLASIAASMVQIVLNDDDELIQRRVETFINTAIQEFRPNVAESVYVHPSCAETITRWVEASSHLELSVRADPAVSPGDCRIEKDGVGISASLENLLRVALARLTDSPRRSEAA